MIDTFISGLILVILILSIAVFIEDWQKKFWRDEGDG